MRSNKKGSKIGIPVNSTWMKEMSTCFEPEINLNHLSDHLCVRDSVAIVAAKITCAEAAFNEIQDVLLPPKPVHTYPKKVRYGNGDVRDNKNSRYYEPPSEDDDNAEEDWNSLPAFTATYIQPGNDFSAKDESLPSAVLAFSKAIPYCHPCTYHLMCKEWSSKYPSSIISYCPLCPVMRGWRNKNNLDIDENYLCYHKDDKNSKKQKRSAMGLRAHISSFANQGDKPYHSFMLAYLSQCDEHLHHHVKSFANYKNEIIYF